MKKKKLFYKEGKIRLGVFLLSGILLFASSALVSINFIDSAEPKFINLFSDSNNAKILDIPSVNLQNSNNHIINEKQQEEETAVSMVKGSEQNTNQQESYTSSTGSISVSAEEVYNFGRDEGKKYVFLTFDDGPNSTITPKILDILKQSDITATFFVVGSAVDSNPEVLKQIFNSGHVIANHTYSHNYRTLYPNKTVNIKEFSAEIEKTRKSVTDVIGNASSLRVVRFPAGSFEKWKRPMKDELIRTGMYFLDWNAENRDGLKNNATIEEQLSTISENITAAESSKKNVVLLMHDSATKQTTADALPFIIELFQSRGYEFGTIK